MRGLQVCLIAVIFWGEVLAASASAPEVVFSTFALADRNPTVAHRVIASSLGRSRRRCAAECLRTDACRQFCYEEATGLCVLEDGSAAPPGPPGLGNCAYYVKQAS